MTVRALANESPAYRKLRAELLRGGADAASG
jgi:hypothetical protein